MKPLKVFFTLIGVFCLVLAVYAVFYDEIRKIIYPLSYEAEISAAAEAYGIPPEKLHAVVKAESNYDAKAVSRVGAKGLMQLMNETASDMAKRLGEEFDEEKDGEKLFEAETNLRYGGSYLQLLYRIYGDWTVVHAAYNAGPGNVNKWLEDRAFSPDGRSLENVPFGETSKYLEKIAKYEKIYKELYFSEQNEQNEQSKEVEESEGKVDASEQSE